MVGIERFGASFALAVILWIVVVITGLDAFDLFLRSSGLALVWAVVLGFMVAGTACRSFGLALGVLLTCTGWIAARGVMGIYEVFLG